MQSLRCVPQKTGKIHFSPKVGGNEMLILGANGAHLPEGMSTEPATKYPYPVIRNPRLRHTSHEMCQRHGQEPHLRMLLTNKTKEKLKTI